MNMDIRRAFYITAGVVLTLLAAYVLYQLSTILIVLFAAVIFASAIRPFVDGLEQRRLPRGLAILLIYVLTIGAILGLLIVTVPPIVRLSFELSTEGILAEQIRALATELAIFGWDELNLPLVVLTLPSQLQVLLGEASDTAQQEVRRQAWPVARTTILVVSQIVLGLAMGYYWLIARDKTLDFLLRISPQTHRGQIMRIWDDIETTLGAYVRGQLILMVVVGTASYVGLYLLGVPYALALAAIAGLTEAIPLVGPFLGAIPAIIVALTVSPLTALLVAGLYVVVQQVEGNVLVPKVMEKSVGLNPLLVIFALVAGGILNGVVGALLAIPVAGALQVIAHHLWIAPALEESGAIEKESAPEAESESSDEEESAGVAMSAIRN